MLLYRRAAPWGLELGGFGRPMGLSRDAQGRWLVADMDCHVLWRIDAQLQRFQWHAGDAAGWSAWEDVRPGAADARPQREATGFHGPHSVEEDASGRLVVTCYYTPRIAAVERSGAVRELAGHSLLRGPATTRIDGDGRLLVSEYALNVVLRLDASGVCMGRLGRDPAHDPLAFAGGTDGVAASALAGGFDRPHMALAAADGSIVVADTWNHRLQRFDAAGRWDACLEDGGGWCSGDPLAAAPRLLDCPVAIDLDALGRMLVTCWGRGEVLLLGPQGRREPLPGLPPLSKPYDARFTERGIAVADTHRGRVLLVDNMAQPHPATARNQP